MLKPKFSFMVSTRNNSKNIIVGLCHRINNNSINNNIQKSLLNDYNRFRGTSRIYFNNDTFEIIKTVIYPDELVHTFIKPDDYIEETLMCINEEFPDWYNIEIFPNKFT